MLKRLSSVPVMIADEVRNWSSEHRQNLAKILTDLDDVDPSPEIIADAFRWLYHNKTRKTFKNWLSDKARYATQFAPGHDEAPELDMEEYLRLVLKHEKINPESESVGVRFRYLGDKVIAEALVRMKPEDRMRFLDTYAEQRAHEQVRKEGGELKGPMGAATAAAAAQASGFGVYLAASTALGLLTHAVGVTLPFAVYAGLSSTIAFLIGPAGWLGIGFWTFLRLTGPNWDKLKAGLLYIAIVRDAPEGAVPDDKEWRLPSVRGHHQRS